MKKILWMLPLVALAACMSPREACIYDAQRSVALLDEQIATTQGNINRGYALAEIPEIRTINTVCTGTNQDGSTFTFPCQETETYTRTEPVAINVAEERAKLRDLQQRRNAAAASLNDRVQQCIAIHPE